MAKLILVFSDGTGQIGGMRPDQRLSNIYKMYRAMRPGPDSPIRPQEQVAFYDAGLGAGETDGFTFRRLRNILSAAVGTGIDENVIDCYAAIIASYQPGDRICLFGFSRGAYTVRSLANVLNLCGVPTKAADGSPVPQYGPKLRKIATDGVRYVYNHGAGSQRSRYEDEREEKARRFRVKYGSEGLGADGESQGNVQPTFVGVFDTVAALGSRDASLLAIIGFALLLLATWWITDVAPWWATALFAAIPAAAAYWVTNIILGQVKYFFKDPDRKIRFWNPLDWLALARHGHIAWWSGKHYDRYIDREVPFLRHALAIDESRAKFPRVPWGRTADVAWNSQRGNPQWLMQVWFAGNHSDIGGSYAEEQSRLSDIALDWMLTELKQAVPEVQIRSEIIVTAPDPLGLQHDEREGFLDGLPSWLRHWTGDRLTWRQEVRKIKDDARLHPSVIARCEADQVPQMGDVKAYRPPNLQNHPMVGRFYQ
ncbi:phospholipase effector Tle1 domain-containing protein [Ancylobacter amanitiformis]|uniref:Uncharacterized protein (DUF2235 family) n=1 Tax=Ancylobacter amanitiformis TaxID=217069 RepID=A0ABU0LXW2_9HYPH|nr:DUF2235 domain-containing protein [Ancylobacter amanitiformis]MDQ0513528.1 uncharacterized protein (DUF2235 family) [Ancylobacter amanitiformis]